jgi:hypothetical protein
MLMHLLYISWRLQNPEVSAVGRELDGIQDHSKRLEMVLRGVFAGKAPFFSLLLWGGHLQSTLLHCTLLQTSNLHSIAQAGELTPMRINPVLTLYYPALPCITQITLNHVLSLQEESLRDVCACLCAIRASSCVLDVFQKLDNACFRFPAGNVFDLGAAASADLFEEGGVRRIALLYFCDAEILWEALITLWSV